MLSKKFSKTLSVAVFAGLLAVPALATAGAVITSGNIALGVNAEGHLNTLDPTGAVSTSNAGGYVGIAYKFADGTWRDATSPGCLCEGWGVSGSGSSGYANVSTDGGANNLTVDSFTSSASSITSKVSLTSGAALSVSQTYAASVAAPGKLFENKVVISNTGATTITDVRYVRVMDWDIPPDEFNEYVTIKGTATTTQLEKSHNNGFNTANPLNDFGPRNPATVDADFVDNGLDDHGAYFRFLFGDLAAGESKEFSIFYGATGTEVDMINALNAAEVELYSLGQWSGDPTGGTPATYAFGFKGVGGVIQPPAVPEPGTILLLGSGLVGLAFWRKRRNS